MTRRSRPYRRRYAADGFWGRLVSKWRPSQLLVGILVMVVLFCVLHFYSGSGGFGGNIEVTSRLEAISRAGDNSCMVEVQQAIPVLKQAYGDRMHKVLHVGPDTCSVVSKLLKEEETEVRGIEPYDVEDADAYCKHLVRRGIVRVADIRFPLPYRPKSFALVIVSDALDYLTPRYLNKSLPDLARVSSDGIVIFAGSPAQQKAKGADVFKFGKKAIIRNSHWWARYFVQTNLEENEVASEKFMQAATMMSYNPTCQIFHLKSFI